MGMDRVLCVNLIFVTFDVPSDDLIVPLEWSAIEKEFPGCFGVRFRVDNNRLLSTIFSRLIEELMSWNAPLAESFKGFLMARKQRENGS